MNSAEIEIQSASFTSGGNTVSSSDIKTNAEDETLTVTFPGSLPLGSGQIHLNFTGILNDKLRGFYRSCYTGKTLKLYRVGCKAAYDCVLQSEFKKCCVCK